ncbi:acetate kinase [Alkalispirochaeta sphaeroplastigenens]|uniref:Acetate kinase n=1 Tax=Alkalispirochaeta sphaeroplastigenens TaxID=1187066 RepID=A0A2S4JVL9_9SPIO|nr:acetate kinase [Alkalispirochaeta sphaeroplastigenens]POR03579.1 acetate kinase [Alkalispirochaeta sphaeroplastigenens]
MAIRKYLDGKNVLVINSGSSSLKYEVYDMPSRTSLGKGAIERIGSPESFLKQSGWNGTVDLRQPLDSHGAALSLMTEALTDSQNGILTSLDEVWGVGHRVVHGGEKYSSSVVIDEEVLAAIEENIELAPLHNPANLTGIREAMELLPGRLQVAVFDTAFHQTLTPAAFLYGLPRELYEKFRIRRYGFHGTSHRYVAAQAVRFAKRAVENTNVISCHLGNGASITAIQNGRSVDTSMGFTPLEGLLMGTRSGDLDPSIIFYLLERGYSAEELKTILNKKSGLLGLSEISNDLRDLEEAAERGDRNAIEALDAYAYRVRKFIGAYAANIVKVDILVFTGGIGQFGTRMRERICHRLENLGIVMDYRKNLENGNREGIISKDYSPTTIIVEPTNEELQIAIDTYELGTSSAP